MEGEEKTKILMATPVPASRLLSVPKSRMDYLATGLEPLDSQIQGFPRGAISEISGARSSGRTSLLFSLLAMASLRGECCAVIDGNSGFDPVSAVGAGVDMRRLLWVRSEGDPGKAVKAADLIIHGGGFGVICLDLTGFSPRVLNRLPTSYWFRFRRAVEHSPTVLLILSERAQARVASSCWLEFGQAKPLWSGRGSFALLRGFTCELWIQKPGRPRAVCLEAKVF